MPKQPKPYPHKTKPVHIDSHDVETEDLVVAIVDGDEITMQVPQPAGVLIQFMEDMGTANEMSAIAGLLRTALGDENYKALKANPGFTMEQFQALAGNIVNVMAGDIEVDTKNA